VTVATTRRLINKSCREGKERPDDDNASGGGGSSGGGGFNGGGFSGLREFEQCGVAQL